MALTVPTEANKTPASSNVATQAASLLTEETALIKLNKVSNARCEENLIEEAKQAECLN